MNGSNAIRLVFFWTLSLALPPAAQAELVLYYSFEDPLGPGGTVVNQANPGVYDGTLQDNAYTNGVLNLDGTGDFLQTLLPTNNLGAPVTFSFWMKASDTSSPGRAIISGYTNHTNRWDIQLSRNGDQKVRFIHHHDNSGPISATLGLAGLGLVLLVPRPRNRQFKGS